MENESPEGKSEADIQSPQSDRPSNLSRRSILHRGAATLGAFTLGTAAASGLTSAHHGITHQFEIDSCTVIDDAGTYLLTQDIEHDGRGACIQIEANNVILDGQGHTLTTQEGDDGIFAIGPTRSNPIRNVTIKNISVTGFTRGIRMVRTAESTIRNSTTSRNEEVGIWTDGDRIQIYDNIVNENGNTGIVTRGDFDRIIRNTVQENVQRGIYVRSPSYSTLVDSNTVTDHTGIDYPGAIRDPGIIIHGTEAATVWGNTLQRNGIGVLLDETAGSTVEHNTLERSDHAAIRLEGLSNGNTIRSNEIVTSLIFAGGILLNRAYDNVVEKHGSAQIRVENSRENILRENRAGVTVQNSESTTLFDNDLERTRIVGSIGTLVLRNRIATPRSAGVDVQFSRDTLVQGNNISGASGFREFGAGVYVAQSARTEVWANGIRDNDTGVRIGTQSRYPDGAETTVAGNNLVGNREYGINNTIEEVVDGRFNYWGASNGPSSPDPEALEDPVTGRLANGDGDAVSESPSDAGVSNVRFHPWARVPQATVGIRFNPPRPIQPPSPIDPPFLPPLELTDSESA